MLHKKGGQTTAPTYAQELDEALCLGWIEGQIARRDDDSYRQRFTPRRPGSPWFARNVEHVTRLTQAGRMRAARIAAVDAAKAQGRWQATYRGQADMQIPPDTAQVLAANPAAAATFDQLDAANPYAIVCRLNAVKRPATPDRKLAEYVDVLARGECIHPPSPGRIASDLVPDDRNRGWIADHGQSWAAALRYGRATGAWSASSRGAGLTRRSAGFSTRRSAQ